MIDEVTHDLVARGFEECTSNSDCDYDGGMCWATKECEVGKCLCDVAGTLPTRGVECHSGK